MSLLLLLQLLFSIVVVVLLVVSTDVSAVAGVICGDAVPVVYL